MQIEENFDFKGEIGKGSFATVWKAIDNLGREVAVKIFNPSAIYVSDEANLQNTISKMILNHAKLLAQVNHPNVVKIHSFNKVKDPKTQNIVDCIVMEFLEGITLEKKLERALSIEEASFIGNSIIDGMIAIHNSNIAHNDFHSKNIMISNNFVKIIDPRYDESTFAMLSSMNKEQLVKGDIRFLKETLRDIIYKTPEISMGKSDEFRNKTRDENDIQKIREFFNESLSKKITDNIQVNVLTTINQINETSNIIEKVKEYISDDRYRIQLDDLITKELKKTLPKLSKEFFPLEGTETNTEKILERLKSYENLISNLSSISIALSHWGNDKQLPVLNKIIERISDNIEMKGGTIIWLKLRWYPLFILFYCSGISAIYSGNYQYLYSLFFHKIQNNTDSYIKNIYLIDSLTKNLTQLYLGDEIFKMIPEYKGLFVPTSEHMFKTIHPILEDNLFLGKSYETLFDKFEIFFSLVYADLNRKISYKGPTGRFVYKYKQSIEYSYKSNLYNDIINEANQKKENWEPLKAGFFDGSYDRFIKAANEYKTFMESLQWY